MNLKNVRSKKNSVVLPEFEILRFHQLSVAIVVLIKKTTKSKRTNSCGRSYIHLKKRNSFE